MFSTTVRRPEPGCCTFNFIHFETNEPNLINVKANISVSLRSDGRTLVSQNVIKHYVL